MFLAFLAVDFLIVVDTRHPEQHHLISGFLLLVAVGIALFIFAFVFLLIAIFLYNGIKILIKEGTRWTNFLSLGTGIVIFWSFQFCSLVQIYLSIFINEHSLFNLHHDDVYPDCLVEPH